MDKRKPYTKPEVIYEFDLETLACSSKKGGDWGDEFTIDE